MEARSGGSELLESLGVEIGIDPWTSWKQNKQGLTSIARFISSSSQPPLQRTWRESSPFQEYKTLRLRDIRTFLKVTELTSGGDVISVKACWTPKPPFPRCHIV